MKKGKSMKRMAAAILTLILILQSVPAMAFVSLKQGDLSTDVQMLQLRLNELGYSVGTPDGDYGQKTVDAVKAFQKDHGLEETGEVDDALWDILYDESVILTQSGNVVDVYLTAPFVKIQSDGTTATMSVDTSECSVQIFNFGMTVDAAMPQVQQIFQDEYNNTAVVQYQASNLNGDIQTMDIDGHKAGIYSQTFDFVGEGNLTSHTFWGGMEFGDADGMPLILVAQINFTLNQGQVPLITADTITEILRRAVTGDEIRESTLAGNETADAADSEEPASEEPASEEGSTQGFTGTAATEDLFKCSTMVPLHNSYINSQPGYQDYEMVSYQSKAPEGFSTLPFLIFETREYSSGLLTPAIGYEMTFGTLKEGDEDVVADHVNFEIGIDDTANYPVSMMVLGEVLEHIADEEGLQDWMLNTALSEVAEKLTTDEDLESVFEGKHIRLSISFDYQRDGLKIRMEPV